MEVLLPVFCFPGTSMLEAFLEDAIRGGMLMYEAQLHIEECQGRSLQGEVIDEKHNMLWTLLANTADATNCLLIQVRLQVHVKEDHVVCGSEIQPVGHLSQWYQKRCDIVFWVLEGRHGVLFGIFSLTTFCVISA